LSNVIGPIANVVALNLAYLVGGVIIVETIFAYPGIAKLTVDAVSTRDMPLLEACAMIFCSAYLLFVLLADLFAIVSNPRLRHPK
jgi:peptide/nickel transport system permease protein